MRRLASIAVVFALGLVAPVATAHPGPRGTSACDGGGERDDRTARRRQRSRSIGLPFRGRIVAAVALEESEHVRYVPEYAPRGSHWGTWQLVQLVERAAERVHQRLPGSRLSVGEMSAREGGHLDGHRSHQNGRDVDLSFYMTNAEGEPYAPYAYAEFGPAGVGRGPNAMLRFDDARNWELVGKLVADGDARVQRIFISNGLKRRLLREGRRRNAPGVLLRRAEQVMVEPAHHAHANHMHVRIYCNPREQGRCEDRAPFHAWYPGTAPE